MVNVLHIEVLLLSLRSVLSFPKALGKSIFGFPLGHSMHYFLGSLSPIPTTVYYATTILLLHVCTMIEEEEEEGAALVAK